MATINRFEDIKIWKSARQLSKDIHLISSSGKFVKDYSLKDQIRRSTGSVMDNVAEVKSQLYGALDQKYISEEEFENLSKKVNEILNMITGFTKYLQEPPKFREDFITYYTSNKQN